MSFRKHVPLVVLAALLVAAVYGVILTRQHPPAAAHATVRRATQGGSLVVDESSLQTVQALLRLPTSPEERESARSALRLADKAGDLAFAQAVWRMAARPPAANASAREVDARLQNALRTLAADKASVDRLTAAMARASVADAARMKDQLELAKAMSTLDQDEVDDAEQDLVTAGGNPQTGFQEMIQQHDAASQASDTLRIAVTPFDIKPGLVSQVSAWQSVRDKRAALVRAGAAADSTAAALRQRHDSIQARASRRLQSRDATGLTHDSATALVAEARRQSLREKALSTLDRRVDNQQQLAAVFASWTTIVDRQERAAINRVLRSVATLLAIALLGILLLQWAERTTSSLSMDRRRVHTLRMVGRVTLQVLGLLLVLLVIFGPPSNLGTFLGLAGAGLTVALKDFIVGFIGWFALMGADGIRPGDLVEINGVTGEVVELGMFYTVLLETGSWTESGHPTGRRVTFMNGFAIEGHYFNFSTSGRWLWDEIRIVVPAGRDPHPIVDAIQREIQETTADSARQAEAQWREARRSPHLDALVVAPSIHLKPISGGVEIIARYITHVAEREELRAKLYRTAVELLGTVALSQRVSAV